MTSSLSPSDWPAISALLDQALALPAAQRLQWIEALGPEHARHREALRRLLARSDVETGDFLQTLPRIDSTLAIGQADLQSGQLIGPYRLLRQIGAGGMGAVWLAERADGALKRRVALKLPRLAWGGGLAERLARERDILASLEHPHIARLYDAGVDQHGRPYLALEYVEGLPIGEYCDTHHLTIRQRLQLMLQVAQAVSFAHSRLVVHPDLKPSNILVTADGQVRLLDFGIAKLLAAEGDEDAGALTAALGQGLTLNYASPEQVEGRQLTTATDQYSLAVVAYELACGTRPFDSRRQRGLALANAIAEADVPAPSKQVLEPLWALTRATTPAALKRELAGDLDAVLCRALSRSPAARYPSIDAFAADLRAWLEQRPVSTRPQRVSYVLLKLFLRYRTASSLLSLAVAAILVASATAAFFGSQAIDESRNAEAARDFFISLLRRADPSLNAGNELSVRELLRLGQEEAASLKDRPRLQRDVYQAIADLSVSFGELDIAAHSQGRVTELFRNETTSTKLADSILTQAEIEWRRERWDAVARLVEEAESVDRSRWPPKLKTRALIQHGWTQLMIHREGEAAYSAFEAARKLAVAERDARLEALAIWGLAQPMSKPREPGERLALLRRSYQLLDEMRESDTNTKVLLLMALSEALYDNGRYVEGFSVTEESLALSLRLFQRETAHLRQRLTWLRFCLALEKPHVAAAWLQQTDVSEALPGYGDPTHAQWHAVAARVWASTGDRLPAAEAIRKGRAVAAAASVPRVSGLLTEVMTLAEARVHLQFDDPKGALRTLVSNALPEAAENSFKAHRSWLEGVAEAALGEHRKALSHLQAAAGYFPANSAHPRVALIRLDIAITKLRLATWSEPVSASDLISDVEFARSTLVEAYGAAAFQSKVATALSRQLKVVGKTISPASARHLLEAAEIGDGLQLFLFS